MCMVDWSTPPYFEIELFEGSLDVSKCRHDHSVSHLVSRIRSLICHPWEFKSNHVLRKDTDRMTKITVREDFMCHRFLDFLVEVLVFFYDDGGNRYCHHLLCFSRLTGIEVHEEIVESGIVRKATRHGLHSLLIV
ncbi:hypothetical protein V6N13_004415 [Hibiscus sabdariffa]|uniref:Uncharacterized protein n=1 Tax=Hibiscus sabdariffa TaxID=183260 RepID=A0ABR2RZ52_9ROSI